MSKTDTWMPLYVADYLGDTMHLSTVQHGAYILLLMHHWRSGALPDDDVQLASIARCDLKIWQKSMANVLRSFFQKTDSGLVQKRLAQEKVKAEELTEIRSKIGKEGAEKRWQRHSKGIAKALPDDMANAWQTDAPLPSPIESKKEEPPLIPPTVPKPVAKAPKTKPRCQLPDDWRPSLDGFKLAQSQGLDFEQTFLRFRDYHRSKGNLMASWEAAWGTWCRSPYNKPQGGKPSGLDENTRRLIELGAAQPIPDAFTGQTLDGEMFQ